MRGEIGTNGRYPVIANDQDYNVGQTNQTQLLPTGTPVQKRPFDNSLPLKTKFTITSRDVSAPPYSSGSSYKMQRIIIPRTPLRRIRPWHRATKGTSQEYAGKLLNIFPELSRISEEEIENISQEVRRKQELDV